MTVDELMAGRAPDAAYGCMATADDYVLAVEPGGALAKGPGGYTVVRGRARAGGGLPAGQGARYVYFNMLTGRGQSGRLSGVPPPQAPVFFEEGPGCTVRWAAAGDVREYVYEAPAERGK